MKSIYLLGCCDYEINGIYHLLSHESKIVSHLSSESLLSTLDERDVLILCLSAIPLLGWGKYLSKIEQLLLSCNAKIIVLTPSHAPHLGTTMHSKQVVFINGTQPIARLYKVLLCTIKRPIFCEKRYSAEAMLNHRHYRFTMDIINEVSVTDRAKMERIPHKTVYHHRSVFIKQLGFSSLQHLQMFLSGVSQKDVKLLCSTPEWRICHEIK